MVHRCIILSRNCRLDKVRFVLKLNQKALPPGYLLENTESLAQYPGKQALAILAVWQCHR